MAIAFVQGTAGDSSGTAVPVTLNGVTAGNFLLIGVAWDNSATLNSLTASAGTPTLVLASSASDKFAVYYIANTSSGNIQITANLSSSATARIAILEYSGIATSSPLDQASASFAASSNSTGSLTPTTNDTLAIAYFWTSPGFNTISGVSSPYSIRLDADRASVHQYFCEAILSSTSATSATSTGASGYAGLFLFKGAGGSSAPIAAISLMRPTIIGFNPGFGK